MNFNDILKLKYSDIQGDTLSFQRGKTAHTSHTVEKIVAIITPEMQQIIDKWGNADKSPDNYIFPFLKGTETPMQEKLRIKYVINQTNLKLHKIEKALGIENLTTYSARHSFATILKNNGANINYISEALGHSNIKTTTTYLSSFEDTERRKNAAILSW
jgi:integrase